MMTQKEAYTRGYCRVCCSYRNGRCQETVMPSLNYRNIPPGMCGLTEQDQKRMREDYGTDRHGGINKK